MPARHRKNERTQEVIHRVYRVSDQLRSAIKTRRTKFNATTAQILSEAIDVALPKLVVSLKQLGFGFEGAKKRPIRFPLNSSILSALATAAKQTGIHQSQLLTAALHITTKGGK
jgi:hypothetical protein